MFEEEAGLEFVSNPSAPAAMARPKTAKPTSDDVTQLKHMLTLLEDTVENEQNQFQPIAQQLEPLRQQYQVILLILCYFRYSVLFYLFTVIFWLFLCCEVWLVKH